MVMTKIMVFLGEDLTISLLVMASNDQKVMTLS